MTPVTNEPRVSVVVPLHNTETYIESAVRSALDSDLEDLEVIVVDDGSTDRSAEIVAGIADSRISLIRLRPSGRPARPRNVGIARSRARYVAFLDADDLIKPHNLSAAVRILDAYPAAGFTFADFERIDEHDSVTLPSALADFNQFQALLKEPVSPDWYFIPQQTLARALLYENFIGTSGVVLRKDILKEIGPFDESTIYAEDLDLWFRLAHFGGAMHWNRIGHSYRDRPKSLTYGPPGRNARDLITVLARERQRWQDRDALRQLDRHIAQNFAGIGYAERRQGNRLLSVGAFAYAFATYPNARWVRAIVGSLLS
jgi:glycosyltransferase involved in cell wall biosynthesis